MSQCMTIGKRVQPLRNVGVLAQLIKKIQNRTFGLPNIGVFYSPPGYGKSFAAAFAATNPELNAIYICVEETWTRKFLLSQIVRELGGVPRGTVADIGMEAKERLAINGRPLLIDEADDVLSKGYTKTIKDLADGSQVPVILIGMEELIENIKKWPLVEKRTLHFAPALPANLRDARLLAEIYCEGVSVADDLLEHILTKNTGNARMTSTDLAHVKDQVVTWGVSSVSLKDWGDLPFPGGEAPAMRRDLK